MKKTHNANIGARSATENFMVLMGTAIRMFVIALVWIIGVALTVAAVAGIVALTISLIVALANSAISIQHFPHDVRTEVSSETLGVMYYPFVICTYLILAIPLFLVVMAATGALRKKNNFTTRRAYGLLGILLVALLLWTAIWAGYYQVSGRIAISKTDRVRK